MSRSYQLFGVFVRVILRNPTLAIEAIRFAWATAPAGWIRRPPFLPLPDPAYRDWRLTTAYGRSDAPTTTTEMREFLEWRRGMRRG